MKSRIITGEWNGLPIWRDETPEETLTRESGSEWPHLKRGFDLAMKTIKASVQIKSPFQNQAEEDLEKLAVKEAEQNL